MKAKFLSKFPEVDQLLLEEYFKIVNKPFDSNYGERHHILPRSLFPELAEESWNIIKLSLEDHFKAHYYLFKLLPNNQAMCYAWVMFSGHKRSSFKEEMLIEYAQEYAQARVKLSEIRRSLTTAYNSNTKELIWLRPDKPLPEGFTWGRPRQTFEQRKKNSDWKQKHFSSQKVRDKVSEAGKAAWKRRGKVKGCHNPVTGEECFISENEKAPEGFILGGKPKAYSFKGYRTFHKGDQEIRLPKDQAPPEGYQAGFSPSRKPVGMNLGERFFFHPEKQIEIRLKPEEQIPDGFQQGRLWQYNLRQTGSNRTNSTRGTLACYNPVTLVETRIKSKDELPEGFILGAKPKTNNGNLGAKQGSKFCFNPLTQVEIRIEANSQIPEGYQQGRLWQYLKRNSSRNQSEN